MRVEGGHLKGTRDDHAVSGDHRWRDGRAHAGFRGERHRPGADRGPRRQPRPRHRDSDAIVRITPNCVAVLIAAGAEQEQRDDGNEDGSARPQHQSPSLIDETTAPGVTGHRNECTSDPQIQAGRRGVGVDGGTSHAPPGPRESRALAARKHGPSRMPGQRGPIMVGVGAYLIKLGTKPPQTTPPPPS
jgi:hypothetical protein